MEAERRPMGRFRAAVRVLRGQRLTPQQMQADFLEMQLAFDSIFDKLSTALSRLVKREKARAEEMASLLDQERAQSDPGPLDDMDKEALRRYAAVNGLLDPEQQAWPGLATLASAPPTHRIGPNGEVDRVPGD